MPQTAKQIKKAIKAIGTIKKTTKTMQLISSSKMQKNARILARSKKYLEQISVIARTVGDSKKTIQSVPTIGAVPLIVLFASDRGLCGSFNTKVVSATKTQYALVPDTLVFAVGKRAGKIKNTVGDALISLYPSAHNNLTTEAVAPVASQISALITAGKVSEIVVVYTAYHSAFSQQVVAQKIYPFDLTRQDDSDTFPQDGRQSYCIEPDADTILSYLTPVYLEAMLFRCWIESTVSEHTARMQAMKNATDAAKDIIDTLTLELNKTRQAAITQEIAQIMGARKSMTTF
jgi:F-type H+-transporting ATPase subunit gamma